MSTNEQVLRELYYSPTGSTSVNKLYQKVKHNGITFNEVKNFINNQESHQVFKKIVRPKHYFPIVAKYKHEILQCDLVDMSNISTTNSNVHFLLTCIDVFSRFLYIIPLKNKNSSSVVQSMEEILKLAHPKILNCDNGKEFINKDFKELMKKYNVEVRYVEVGDHHKLGIIDRMVRTLRELINKYMFINNTNKYINALPELVQTYNNSFHSTLKMSPSEVKDNDERIINISKNKYNLAKSEEAKFNINDKVRYIINPVSFFEKRTNAKWSKTIHNIVDKNEHSYKLDNGTTKKYYELQLIETSESLNKPVIQPTIQQIKKQNTIKRRIKKEGIEISNIIKKKRVRQPTDRLHY
jgi:hypothetical protein